MKVFREKKQTWWRPASLAAVAVAAVAAWIAFARPAENPDVVWEEVHNALANDQIDRAEASLTRLRHLREPTVLDRIVTAQVDVARGRIEKGLTGFASVPDDHRLAAEVRLNAGNVEFQRGHIRAAEALFKEAVRLDPNSAKARQRLISIYLGLLRRRELNAQFLALSKITPLSYDNVWHWCLTRNSKWSPTEEIPKLEGYLKADPDDRMSRLALAENYRTVGRRDEAGKLLDHLGEADPDARALRVQMALEAGDDASAENLLKEGPPDHPDLARLRGKVALTHRDGPTALKHFQLAYKVEPDNRDTLFGLGQALILTGDAKAAEPFVQMARDHDAFATLMQRASIRENRSDPALLRSLGAACEKIHRIPEARAWYRLAIDLDAFDAEAQHAFSRLKDIEDTPQTPSSKPDPKKEDSGGKSG